MSPSASLSTHNTAPVTPLLSSHHSSDQQCWPPSPPLAANNAFSCQQHCDSQKDCHHASGRKMLFGNRYFQPCHFNHLECCVLSDVKPDNSFHCHQPPSCCRASGRIFCSFLDVIHADSPQSTVSTVRVDHEKCQKLIIILSPKYREWQGSGVIFSSHNFQTFTSLFKLMLVLCSKRNIFVLQFTQLSQLHRLPYDIRPGDVWVHGSMMC